MRKTNFLIVFYIHKKGSSPAHNTKNNPKSSHSRRWFSQPMMGPLPKGNAIFITQISIVHRQKHKKHQKTKEIYAQAYKIIQNKIVSKQLYFYFINHNNQKNNKSLPFQAYPSKKEYVKRITKRKSDAKTAVHWLIFRERLSGSLEILRCIRLHLVRALFQIQDQMIIFKIGQKPKHICIVMRFSSMEHVPGQFWVEKLKTSQTPLTLNKCTYNDQFYLISWNRYY